MRCFLPEVRFGSCACPGRLRFSLCEVGSGASVLPPLLWSWPVSVGLRFSFPLPFQGLPVPGQVCWCVFSPSFPFLRSPLGSLLSNFHLIFIVISPSSVFILTFISLEPIHALLRQGVCVERLHRRKTSVERGNLYTLLYM